MKYIITESQYGKLQEVNRVRGRHFSDPLSDFFGEIKMSLIFKKSHFVEAFRKFFKKLGISTEDFNKEEIKDYWDELEYGRDHFFGPIFYKKDSIAGFAYYIAKNYFGLKEGAGGIQYLTTKTSFKKAYYFFDPEFKILVGGLAVTKDDEIEGKAREVSIAAVDPELIGGRYGLKMYLTVIDNVDYLSSDTTLFTGSYRMWAKSLPKYVNVWVVTKDKAFSKTKKITGEESSLPKNFDVFVASSKHDKINFSVD